VRLLTYYADEAAEQALEVDDPECREIAEQIPA